MSTVKDCPGCGKGFLKGRKVLFPVKEGRLIRRLVCLKCSSSAERIVTKVSAKPCMMGSCPNAAHICSKHHAADLQHVRDHALEDSLKRLAGVIKAMRHTAPKEPTASDFMAGRLDGLTSALEALTNWKA